MLYTPKNDIYSILSKPTNYTVYDTSKETNWDRLVMCSKGLKQIISYKIKAPECQKYARFGYKSSHKIYSGSKSQDKLTNQKQITR